MRGRIRWCGLALVALALGVAQAAKPDFSGNWKLNAAKSDFGAMPTPARTDKIRHNDPILLDSYTQSGPQGEISVDMKYSTDGQETTSSLHGSDLKSVAKWEGDQLVIEGKLSLNGAEVTLKDRWSLSADGKTLTIQRHADTPMGQTHQKIVLEKQ
jgi:hypothetical protein